MAEDTNNTPADEQAPEASCDACQSHAPGCACSAGQPTTEEERAEAEAAIQSDPAARSLSSALATSFVLLKLSMLVVLGFFLLDCVTYVEEGSVGLKKIFGEYVTDENGNVREYKAGKIVFILPEPIMQLETVRIDRAPITIESEFWPKGRPRPVAEEEPELEAKEQLAPGIDGYNITGDRNILHTRWEISYLISSPARYQMAAAQTLLPDIQRKVRKGEITPRDIKPEHYLKPEDLLRQLSVSIINRKVAGVAVDDFLSSENASRIVDEVASEIEKELAVGTGRDWGMSINKVNIISKTPPGKANPAFAEVNSANNQRQTKIQDADAERRRIEQEAQSQAQEVINAASVYKQRVVAKARADAEYLTNLTMVSPLFNPADIREGHKLAALLRSPETRLQKILSARIPADTREKIAAIEGTGDLSEEQMQALTDALNASVTSPDLAGNSAFAHISLRNSTDFPDFIERCRKARTANRLEDLLPKEKQMLQRLLLDGALPDMVAPLTSLRTSPASLRMFLTQDRLNRIREVLATATVYVMQPGSHSVLITTPRPPSPLEEKKER